MDPVDLSRLSKLLIVFPMVLLAHIAATQAAEEWDVDGTLFGKKDKTSEDISGIACTTTSGFPRYCLVIDDNVQAAQFVTLHDGRLKAHEEVVPLIENKFDGTRLELDGEGVAYANGYFFVIGSHGHPRDKDEDFMPPKRANELKARIAASSQLIRFRIKSSVTRPVGPEDIEDMQRSPRLRDIIAAEPSLKRFVDRRLENNGVTIEGVAVIGDQLYVGFRAPTLENGRTPVLTLSVNDLFAGAAPHSKLRMLPVGEGRGIRDLTPFDNGLLVLAGPSGEEAGPYTIYWWDTTSENLRHLSDITEVADATKKRKPEALLPLDQGPSGLRLLVLFDGPEQGGPRPIVIPAP
jgi:hypothetical protein